MKTRINPFVRSTALTASIVLCLGTFANAANFSWDGSDTGVVGAQGGIGGWDTNSTSNWWNGTSNVADGAAASDLTIASVIADGTGSGSMIKTGLGTQPLASANTYTGATTVSGGTLALGATGSIANTSAIDIAAGARFERLAGSGLTYSVWTSEKLITWTEDTAAIQTPTPARANESVAVTLSATPKPLTASRLFIRVRAN
jgi:autotransporter-associated beta strand protein